jgi:PIN domain nuclease of toxin-antitoxin system
VRVVADTHTFVWFHSEDARLSGRARDALDDAQRDPEGGIVLSVATRLDLHYLQRSARFSSEAVRRLWAVTDDPSANITVAAITAAVVDRFDAPELARLTDPWDRLITATAIELGVPLVTRDRAITAVATAGALEVIW